MSSLTQAQALSSADRSSVAAIPEHGQILDIGGSALKCLNIDKLKDTLTAIAESKDAPTLPDELLYDDVGLLMWNKIMSIPQFYQTHDETALFDLNSAEIIRQLPRHVTMIDLGSGDINKVDHFLAEFERKKVQTTYLALDISKTSLDQSIASLTANHSGPDSVVNCAGLWGTFENGLDHMDKIKGPRLFLSLGSVLCNDPWSAALGHLKRWASELRPEDHLLIGMDGHLVAGNRDKIWAAYHSCDDMFREFFLNGLKNANKLLGYELFKEQDWDFNSELQEKPTTRHRFFMRARKDVQLAGGDNVIYMGQEIDWFDSHKYGEQDVRLMCSKAGLTVLQSWAAPGSEFRQYLVRTRSEHDNLEDGDSGIAGII
ncbi:DUF323 domain-containing protein [Beauveria brongniartii RCEF 3172]|uniref:DUF323 domain-containing protein n=1 Tax=Beauveria brongniartii RCEF 3172 TaxID=1081107 RepID=A0A167DHG9_9HYPO|nr:DUF323 domain-containing protein [Beauveria brongniartii RCEF 3172]